MESPGALTGREFDGQGFSGGGRVLLRYHHAGGGGARGGLLYGAAHHPGSVLMSACGKVERNFIFGLLFSYF